MRKSISILFVFFLALALTACANPPVKPVASQEVQRSHAKDAQDELSTEVHK